MREDVDCVSQRPCYFSTVVNGDGTAKVFDISKPQIHGGLSYVVQFRNFCFTMVMESFPVPSRVLNVLFVDGRTWEQMMQFFVA